MVSPQAHDRLMVQVRYTQHVIGGKTPKRKINDLELLVTLISEGRQFETGEGGVVSVSFRMGKGRTPVWCAGK